jgi:hypothetical protein
MGIAYVTKNIYGKISSQVSMQSLVTEMLPPGIVCVFAGGMPFYTI